MINIKESFLRIVTPGFPKRKPKTESDVKAARLMTEFAEILREPGMSDAAALRKAVCKTRKLDSERDNLGYDEHSARPLSASIVSAMSAEKRSREEGPKDSPEGPNCSPIAA